ncbi:MAG: ABC transporter ATP-binding protein [Promethearchaeota archaeon]
MAVRVVPGKVITPYRVQKRLQRFKTSFRQIISTYLFEYKGKFVQTLVLSVTQTLLFLSIPLFAQWAIDSLANKDFQLLLRTFGYLLVIVVLHGAVMFYRLWLNNQIGNAIIYNLRNDLFSAIQAQSYTFLDNNRTGDLMSRTTSDVNLLKTLMSSQLAYFIRQLLTFVLAFVVMFAINATLASLILIFMPVIFFTMYTYRRKMAPAFARARKTYGRLTSILQENVNGVRVVRAFAREEEEHRKFKVENDAYYADSLKIAKYQAIFTPVLRLLNFACMILIIMVGGSLAYRGVMTFGNLFAFILLMNFSIDPLQFISQFLGDLSKIGAACDRVTEILNARVMILDAPDAREMPAIEGRVEFQNVWFSYLKDGHYELRDVSFVVEPGEIVAILGSTGAGKTTLMNVLCRFYEVDRGRILIDGVDIREVTKQSLRRQIGMVAQETILFGESIADNITKGQPWRRDDVEAIVRAAKLADIHEFVVSLPEGYDTIVGERGVTLSGGQKQRLSIARAIFTNPRILIFDDATSSVDVDTEYEIQENFAEMFAGATTFIITQRLSTVRNADRIFVMEHGEIRESGTHESLLARKDGIYSRLYRTLKVEERM